MTTGASDTRSIYRRLARNSAFLGGGTALAAVVMMLTVVLNARAFSARDFGVLAMFQSAILMVTGIMSFSTQQPLIKLGAEAKAQGDSTHLGRLIGLGLLIDVAAALIACAGAFLFLFAGRSWLGLSPGEFALAAVFAGSLLFTGYLTSNGIFRLLDRFDLLSLIQAGCALGLLIATAALYLSGARFADFCWTWAVFYALNAQLPLLVSLALARRAGIPIGLSPAGMPRGEVRTFLAYCWSTWGMATTESFRTAGDSLLVGAVVSAEAAGVYNVAKQLAGVLRKANTVYASAMFPEISALSARGQADQARRVRARILRVSGLIGAIMVAGAAIAGQLVLVHLFGTRFSAAYLPLVILTAAAACQLVSHTLSMYVQVYVGPERLFAIYLIGLVLFALLVFPLTHLWSIDGTAFAQLLFSLAVIYLCHLALRRSDAA